MSRIIVAKFGGTSISKLTHVGVLKRLEADFPRTKVICVLSAEQDITNNLIRDFGDQLRATANEIGIDPESIDDSKFGVEYDLHVSYGEIKSIWKASIAAKLLGKRAAALTAWQAKVRSTDNHRHAVITDIDAAHYHNLLSKYDLLLVAGFQGVSSSENITTLGRGASDLTAVALAAAMNLDEVFIYTDVEGIFSVDPRLFPDAQLISKISYDEALELSSYGNKVIHERAVSLAQKYCTDIVIRTSFQPKPTRETRITSLHSLSRLRGSNGLVTGIAVRKDIAHFTVSMANRPGKANALYARLLMSSIPIPSVAQGLSDGYSTISLAVDKAYGKDSRRLLDELKRERVVRSFAVREDISEISIVGRELTNVCGFLSDVQKLLSAQKIEPFLMSTSGIRVTMLIPTSDLQTAITTLHAEFFRS